MFANEGFLSYCFYFPTSPPSPPQPGIGMHPTTLGAHSWPLNPSPPPTQSVVTLALHCHIIVVTVVIVVIHIILIIPLPTLSEGSPLPLHPLSPPPLLPMVPHTLPEPITPCCTPSKCKGTHNDTDVETDVAHRESQSSSSSPSPNKPVQGFQGTHD